MTQLLYEVRPSDGVALLVPAAMWLTVAIGASLVPARRAASVDPLVALRDE